jgi:hypothetical protein
LVLVERGLDIAAKTAIATLIVALVLAIYYRAELWRGAKWLGDVTATWATEWVPDHPGLDFFV